VGWADAAQRRASEARRRDLGLSHDIDEVMNEHPRPPSLQEVMTGHKVRAGDRPQTTNSEQDMSPKAEREMGPVSEYDCQGSGNRSEDLIAVVAETQDGERQRPASAGSSSALVGAAVRTSSKSGLDASEAKSAEESAVPLTHVHVEAHERASAGHAHGHHSDKELTRMGLLTALAIAIHNFPEGLATFVAALDDPSVGIPIAVAIAIHNIPEGLCVSMPILYASHSRCKAFWWSFLSGVTEPIGALLGYFLLRAIFSDLTFGVLFGLVSGMMVYISFRELIPTARKSVPRCSRAITFGSQLSRGRRYDPTDRVVTVSLVIGMAVMAISLILFQVA
jgi:zinc transporter ZupT